MRRFAGSPVLGALLLALFGAWCLFSRPEAPEATSWAAACLLVAGGLLAGAALGRVAPGMPGVLALAVAVGAVAVTAPASLSGDPAAPPLGYMNANGALLLGGAAGGVAAVRARSVPWTLGAAGCALVLGCACLVGGAQAAAVGCLGVAAWGLLRARGPSWVWWVTALALVVVPPLLTVGWASGALERPGWVVLALSRERVSLWTEAWDLLVSHPLAGVGPGRFSLESPTAADPDLAWAHSALLQTGAELGWVGVGMLLVVVAWALVAVGRDGVLVGLLLLPASVDYVLHFGGVLLLFALVLGGATAAPERIMGPTRAGRGPEAPPSLRARADRPRRAC